jgi:ubiquinone/menaquinone biosynthesis C-methylase UbiE
VLVGELESGLNGASLSGLSWEEAVRWLLSRPEHAQLVKDCYYDQPSIEAARRFESSDEWQATRELLPSGGGRVLDVGAGQGVSTYALAKSGFRVAALEPDASDLVGCGAIARLAEEFGEQVEVVRGVGEALPFAAETFDLVYCRQALHHAADIHVFCREAARVLKPQGLFIAAREHVISAAGDLQRFRDEHVLHKLYGGESAYRKSEYLNAMRRAGLSIVRVISSFDSPINYAPLTTPRVCEELQLRAQRVPGAALIVRRLGQSALGMDLLLKAASIADRRPGRLNSFVSVKGRATKSQPVAAS